MNAEDDLRLLLTSNDKKGLIWCIDSMVDVDSVIHRLAAKMGHLEESIVRIAFDDMTDAKDLEGQWRCTDDERSPFEFVPGFLAQAIVHGWWVAIDGIETTSSSVLSKLSEVVGLTTDTQREVHDNFRIIAIHYRTDDLTHPIPGVGCVSQQQENQDMEEEFLYLPPDYFKRLECSQYLSTWPVVVTPVTTLAQIQDRLLPTTPAHLQDVVRWLCTDLYPLFVERMRDMKSRSQVPAAAIRRLPNLRDLEETCQRVAKYAAQLNALRHWPNQHNVPEQTRLLLAKIVTLRWTQHYPLFVRKLLTEFFIKSFHLETKGIEQDLIHPILPGYEIPQSSARAFAPTSIQESVFSAAAIDRESPIVFVGGTGTGKTALCQALAQSAGAGIQLKVYNCHDQSESSDLIGDMVPESSEAKMTNLLGRILQLRRRAGEVAPDLVEGDVKQLKAAVSAAKADMKAARVLADTLVDKGIRLLTTRIANTSDKMMKKKQKMYLRKYQDYHNELATKKSELKSVFKSGILLDCLEHGHWLLLDEINLANRDVISRLLPLFSSEKRTGAQTFVIHEDGGRKVWIHPQFRILATMNPPATLSLDGQVMSVNSKRELPPTLRSKLSEIYVDDLYQIHDIAKLVRLYPMVVGLADKVSGLYLDIVDAVHTGALEAPQGTRLTFNLRALTRALHYAQTCVKRAEETRSVAQLMADAFRTFVAASLTEGGRATLEKRMLSFLGPDAVRTASLTAVTLPKYDAAKPLQEYMNHFKPSVEPVNKELLRVEGYLIETGPESKKSDSKFICTPSVKKTVQMLARLMSGSSTPILLEGPTSAGKTSLVQFLCGTTRHKFVRINNHEQTTLSEYLGQYVATPDGGFSFQPGPLLVAVQEGHWVVLDEFNLAPAEVVEGLNRLLDDNRELYVPELNKSFVAHKNFRLFATQNPVTYGGRKQLSEALRTRFVEFYITEPPADELVWILAARCPQLPIPLARCMVDVFEAVRIRFRGGSDTQQTFEVLMTIRDLLRWAKTLPETKQDVVMSGFRTVGERLRSETARQAFFDLTVESVFKGKSLDRPQFDTHVHQMYTSIADAALSRAQENNLSMTKPMIRLLSLAQWCWQENEPCILVGATGAGKTAGVQCLSEIYGKKLHIVNGQQNLEVSDLIGGFKPASVSKRELDVLISLCREIAEIHDASCSDSSVTATSYKTEASFVSPAALLTPTSAQQDESMEESSEVGSQRQTVKVEDRVTDKMEHGGNLASPASADLTETSFPAAHDDLRRSLATLSVLQGDKLGAVKISESTLNDLVNALQAFKGAKRARTGVLGVVEQASDLAKKMRQLFVWKDGPLIEAMLRGEPFLLDEVNLIDDAVVERLNSVLEPERFMLIPERAERADVDAGVVQALPGFRFFATMNPSGDYGKKEVSKALVNRLFEVFVPPVSFKDDSTRLLVNSRLSSLHANDETKATVATMMLDLLRWLEDMCLHPVSMREAVAWISGLIELHKIDSTTSVWMSTMHSLFVSLVDGFLIGNRLKTRELAELTAAELNVVKLAVSEEQREQMQKRCMAEDTARICLKALSLIPGNDHEEVYRAFLCDGTQWVSWPKIDAPHRCIEFTPQIRYSGTKRQVKGQELLAAKVQMQFEAPTSRLNLARLVRGLATEKKPVLLEGPPGAGKTALLQWTANTLGCKLYRFNLSEQTELSDLSGSFVPQGAVFKWEAGGLVSAILDGDWVLLDEINLAPQTVLEGLNSLLDHRRELFVPEIGHTFKPAENFRLFAAQNSSLGGGGRKGLPQSFLNRFVKIRVDALTFEDYTEIAPFVMNSLPSSNLRILSAQAMLDLAKVTWKHTAAREWEWNVRDMQRLQKVFRALQPAATSRMEESATTSAQTMETLVQAFCIVFGTRLHDSDDIAVFTQVLQRHFPSSLLLRNLPYEGVVLAETLHVDQECRWRERSLTDVLTVAIDADVPVILSGPQDCGKTRLIRHLLKPFEQSLRVIHMCPTLDGSDLMGQFGQLGGTGGLGWQDSELVRAVAKGEWVLLKNVQWSQPGVLDRINALLEVGGFLTVSEGGSFRKIEKHPKFRLFISTTGFANDKGISPAVRNRCLEIDCAVSRPQRFPVLEEVNPPGGETQQSNSSVTALQGELIAQLKPIAEVVLDQLWKTMSEEYQNDAEKKAIVEEAREDLITFIASEIIGYTLPHEIEKLMAQHPRGRDLITLHLVLNTVAAIKLALSTSITLCPLQQRWREKFAAYFETNNWREGQPLALFSFRPLYKLQHTHHNLVKVATIWYSQCLPSDMHEQLTKIITEVLASTAELTLTGEKIDTSLESIAAQIMSRVETDKSKTDADSVLQRSALASLSSGRLGHWSDSSMRVESGLSLGLLFECIRQGHACIPSNVIPANSVLRAASAMLSTSTLLALCESNARSEADNVYSQPSMKLLDLLWGVLKDTSKEWAKLFDSAHLVDHFGFVNTARNPTDMGAFIAKVWSTDLNEWACSSLTLTVPLLRELSSTLVGNSVEVYANLALEISNEVSTFLFSSLGEQRAALKDTRAPVLKLAQAIVKAWRLGKSRSVKDASTLPTLAMSAVTQERFEKYLGALLLPDKSTNELRFHKVAGVLASLEANTLVANALAQDVVDKCVNVEVAATDGVLDEDENESEGVWASFFTSSDELLNTLTRLCITLCLSECSQETVPIGFHRKFMAEFEALALAQHRMTVLGKHLKNEKVLPRKSFFWPLLDAAAVLQHGIWINEIDHTKTAEHMKCVQARLSQIMRQCAPETSSDGVRKLLYRLKKTGVETAKKSLKAKFWHGEVLPLLVNMEQVAERYADVDIVWQPESFLTEKNSMIARIDEFTTRISGLPAQIIPLAWWQDLCAAESWSAERSLCVQLWLEVFELQGAFAAMLTDLRDSKLHHFSKTTNDMCKYVHLLHKALTRDVRVPSDVYARLSVSKTLENPEWSNAMSLAGQDAQSNLISASASILKFFQASLQMCRNITKLCLSKEYGRLSEFVTIVSHQTELFLAFPQQTKTFENLLQSFYLLSVMKKVTVEVTDVDSTDDASVKAAQTVLDLIKFRPESLAAALNREVVAPLWPAPLPADKCTAVLTLLRNLSVEYVMETTQEEENAWTMNVRDWGTADDDETEAKRLQPLVDELFPQVRAHGGLFSSDDLHEESDAQIDAEDDIADNESGKESWRQLPALLRAFIENSFWKKANVDTALKGVLTEDFSDDVIYGELSNYLSMAASSLQQETETSPHALKKLLIFEDCDTDVRDVYTGSSLDWLPSLMPSLLKIQERLKALVDEQNVEVAGSPMAPLLQTVGAMSNLHPLTATPATVAYWLEILWDQLNHWRKRYARKEDAFDAETTTVAVTLSRLKQAEIASWKSLLARRQLQFQQRFFEKTFPKLLSVVLVRDGRIDNATYRGLVLAHVEQLFTESKNGGCHVNELPLLRESLRLLSALISRAEVALNVQPLDSIADVLQTAYVWTERYLILIKEHIHSESAAIQKEVNDLCRMTGFQAQAVDRDRRNLVTKRLQLARLVERFDRVIRQWVWELMPKLKAAETTEKLLGIVKRVPYPEEREQNSDIEEGDASEDMGKNDAASIEEEGNIVSILNLCEAVETLLVKKGKTLAQRQLSDVRKRLSDLIPTERLIWRESKAVKIDLHESLLEFRSQLTEAVTGPDLGRDGFWAVRTVSEFLSIEEPTMDPSFQRVCRQFQAIIGSLSTHVLEQALVDISVIQRVEKLERFFKSLNAVDLESEEILIVAARPFEISIEATIYAIQTLLKVLLPPNEGSFLTNHTASVEIQNLKTSLKGHLAKICRIQQTIAQAATVPKASGLKSMRSNDVKAWRTEFENLRATVQQAAPQALQASTAHALLKTIDQMLDKCPSMDCLQVVKVGNSKFSLDPIECTNELETVVRLTYASGVIVNQGEHPSVASALEMLREYVARITATDEELLQLVSITAVVFREIARNGMPVEEDKDEDEEKEQDPRFRDEWVQGEGLGEGSGARDMDDEDINDMDLDTLKENPSTAPQKREERKEGEDKGHETGMDFDGEMEDVPKGEGEEDGEEKGDDAEEEFGEVDGDEDQIQGGDDEEAKVEEQGRKTTLDKPQQGEKTEQEENTEEGLDEAFENQVDDAQKDGDADMGVDLDENAAAKQAQDGDTEHEGQDKEKTGDDDEAEGSAESEEEKEGFDDDASAENDGQMDDDPKVEDAKIDEIRQEEESQTMHEDLPAETEEVPETTDEVDADMGVEDDGQEPDSTEKGESGQPEEPQQGTQSAGGGKQDEVTETAGRQDEAGQEGEEGDASGAASRGGTGKTAGVASELGARQQDEHKGVGKVQNPLQAKSERAAQRVVRELLEAAGAPSEEEQIGDEEDMDAGVIDESAEQTAQAMAEEGGEEETREARNMGEQRLGDTEKSGGELQYKTEQEKSEKKSAAMDENLGDDDETVKLPDATTDEPTKWKWDQMEESVVATSAALCESLRTVLEPTNRGRYSGFYKTGKKLSMKQVLAYIASGNRKDRIWLRRNKLSKRKYQIILAMDNSASMKRLGAHEGAVCSMVSIALALRRLEAGDLSLVSYGQAQVETLLRFGSVLDPRAGQGILDRLTFDVSEKGAFDTSMPNFLEGMCGLIEDPSELFSDDKKLLLILSDGRFNKYNLSLKLRRLQSLGVTPVLVIIDLPESSPTHQSSSIFNVKQPKWVDGKLDLKSVKNLFLDPSDFPFQFYTVVESVDTLPTTLAQVVSQWIAFNTDHA